MADPEQLALIQKGIETWNVWRRENPDIPLDLGGADLMAADLRGRNSKGETSRGKPPGARLPQGGPPRSEPRQSGPRRSEPRRGGPPRGGPGGDWLRSYRPRRRKWMDECRHVGPSSLDFQTLQRSGPLPLAFLRGA